MSDAQELEGTNSNTGSPHRYPQHDEEVIHISTKCLENQTLIDFVETDGEFIVSAGKDHDIKVWDAEKEILICRLSGHSGSVTGLKFRDAPSEEGLKDPVVISASEDGTIRQWSILKGKELRKLETAHIITCMGTMTNRMVATGNHIGFLEVYHLETGRLYSSIAAHIGPIEDLMVYGIYICTAVFDTTGSLNVWQLKWGKMLCLYRLEEMNSIEFSAFTMHGETLILGEAKHQKLTLINYVDGEKTCLDLKEGSGEVQHVKVMENLLLSTTADGHKNVFLHIYDVCEFEQLALIFCGNMERISATTLIINCSKLKIIVGGTALAIHVLELPSGNRDTEDSFRKNYMDLCNLKTDISMVAGDRKAEYNIEEKDLSNATKNYNSNHGCIEAKRSGKEDIGNETKHGIKAEPNEKGYLGITIKNHNIYNDIKAEPGVYAPLNMRKSEIFHADARSPCSIKSVKKISDDTLSVRNRGLIKLPPIDDTKNLAKVEQCENNKFAENVHSEKSKKECIQTSDYINANILEKEMRPGKSIGIELQKLKTNELRLCEGINKIEIKEDKIKTKYTKNIKKHTEQPGSTSKQTGKRYMQASYQKQQYAQGDSKIIQDKQKESSKRNNWLKISTKKKQQYKLEKSQQKKDKECKLM